MKKVYNELNQATKNTQLNNPTYELKVFFNDKEISLVHNEKEFSELNLHKQLQSNLKEMLLSEMTEIQKNVIKLIDEGKDVMGCSKTGSGKTIAFLLPIINKLLSNEIPHTPASHGVSYPVAIVLAPTRELVEQIYAEARKICYKTNIIVTRVYGGVPHAPQLRDLRNGADIIIATPGRLNDFINNSHINLELAQNLIIDEADRMLDMGFEPQINRIIYEYKMPAKDKRQNLFFSATFPKEVKELARNFMNNYYFVSVNNNNEAIANENIKHLLVQTSKGDETNKLVELIKELKGSILSNFFF